MRARDLLFKIAEEDTGKNRGRAQSFEDVSQTSVIRTQYYSSGEYIFLAVFTISPGIKTESVSPKEYKLT